MITGKHKKELEDLKADVVRLKLENEKLKNAMPQVREVYLMLQDLNAIGAGILEIRRLDPDKLFLVR